MLGHGEITAVLRRGFTEAGLAGPRPFLSLLCSMLSVPRENCEKPATRERTSPRKSERKLSFSLGLVS